MIDSLAYYEYTVWLANDGTRTIDINSEDDFQITYRSEKNT